MTSETPRPLLDRMAARLTDDAEIQAFAKFAVVLVGSMALAVLVVLAGVFLILIPLSGMR